MDIPPRMPDFSEEPVEKKVRKRLAKKDSPKNYQETLSNMQELAEGVVASRVRTSSEPSSTYDLVDEKGEKVFAIISARPRVSYFSKQKKAPVFESRIFVHTRLEKNLADPRMSDYLKPEDMIGYLCTVGIGESARSFAIFTMDYEQAKTIHAQIVGDLEKTGDTAFALINDFLLEHDAKRHTDKSLPVLRKMDHAD